MPGIRKWKKKEQREELIFWFPGSFKEVAYFVFFWKFLVVQTELDIS
jgi:hypothetical protein